MPADFLSMIISPSLAFEQMVTLQLLNQHEGEKEESSSEEEEEEEERPQRPSQEQSVLASPGPSQAPLSRERQESPMVPLEQVVKEADPLPPQAFSALQDDIQRRDGELTEAETLSEMKDDSFPPEVACIPSQRALEPPTSLPPKPPGPIMVDSECEETLAASPLENVCVEEQESAIRLSLTLDSKMGDPLAFGPKSLGREPQSPELKNDEDVTSSTGSSKELSSTEAGSIATGAALGPKHCSQHSRYVPLSRLSGTRWSYVEVVFVFLRAGNSSLRD